MHRYGLTLLLLAVGLLAGGSSTAQYLTIDLESPSSITSCSPSCSPPTTHYLHDNGEHYTIYEHGSWHVVPWLSPSQHVEGVVGLGFDAFVAPDNNNVADRSELAVILNNDSQALKIGKRRYLGFYMKIDSASDVPRNWTLLHQAWQCCGGSPPFALYVKTNPTSPNGDIVVQARIRNDETGSGHSAGFVVWQQVLTRGTWYEFIFQYQPSYEGYTGSGYQEGQLALWFNGAPLSSPTFVYRGDFGYDYTSNPNVIDAFDLRVGVYRRKQQRRMKVFFDYIVYGPTAASVGL